jgi:hypothetical protein
MPDAYRHAAKSIADAQCHRATCRPGTGWQPRAIRLPDRLVTAEIAAKSLRKAQTPIRVAGADNSHARVARPPHRPVTRLQKPVFPRR